MQTKRVFSAIFKDKAAQIYAISHKINNREKRSSPWPLVSYNGAPRLAIPIIVSFTYSIEYLLLGDLSPSELCLEFRVYLKSAKTEKYIQERRVIGFWFKPQFPSSQKTTTAQEFFKTLVAPVDFPRGKQQRLFIIMNLLMKPYNQLGSFVNLASLPISKALPLVQHSIS